MKDFWDHKANEYPTPLDEDGLKTPRKVVAKVKEFGVDFENKNILDIGCGTGIYSSLIKDDAKSILGVDISNGMLDRFRDYIKRKKIKNIEIKQKDFKKFNTKKKFDIVLSAMTPAVSSFEDLETMISLSKETCIHVSFSKNKYSPVFDNILEQLDMQNLTCNNFQKTKDYLVSKGFMPKEETFEHNWTQIKTIDEMLEDILEHGKLKNKEINQEKALRVIKKHAKNGIIVKETFAQVGVLVWRV